MQTLTLGTRGSKLALKQTDMVKVALERAHPDMDVRIEVIQTSGDWKPEHGETRLSEAKGGKGQFAKEIEQALMKGRIDAGVHSVKDMESFLPEGMALDHFLPRDDPRDGFISNHYGSLKDMPAGATIGTSSVRRAAMIKNVRSDLKIAPLRGNVPTRLEKLDNGQVDATILAVAGLNRLNLSQRITKLLEAEEMLPAVGQGAIGLEILTERSELTRLLEPINCSKTRSCIRAERAALAVLDGSCHTPIGAYAHLHEDGQLHLRLAVYALDGTDMYQAEIYGAPDDASSLGESLGQSLKTRLPEGFLE